MATYTNNLKLVKPELNDLVSPTVFADNFDKIDTAYGDLNNSLSDVNSNLVDIINRLTHRTYYSDTVPSEGIIVKCGNLILTDNISVSIYIDDIILGSATIDRNLFVNGLHIRTFWCDQLLYYFDVAYIDNEHISIVGNTNAINAGMKCLVLGV